MSVAVLLTVFAVAGRVISHSGDSGSGISGSGAFICNPEDYSMQTPSVPFPTLPNQFFTLIEVSSNYYNATNLAVEYYDSPGNRVRLDLYYQDDNQKEKEVSIFDYSKNEVILIPDRSRNVECSVQTISDHEEYVDNYGFGVTIVNGSIHVKSAGGIYVAGNSSVMYMGVETVRGIQCNHWQTCYVDDNSSYMLDYYFATSNWEFALSGETEGTVLVQIEVTDLYGGVVVYSFIAFESGPDAVPDSAFAIPTGLPCVGRPAGKDLPLPPRYFSILIESQENPMSIGTIQEFYDYDMALFRFDSQFNSTPYSFIHDFTFGLEYIIDRRISACYVVPLENASMFYDVISGPDGNYNLRSPSDFWRLGSGHNFSYEGVTTVRGIEADAWIAGYDTFILSSYSTLVNGTVELFYSQPGWNITTVYSYNSDPIPLAINLTGTLVNTCDDDEMCEPEREYSALYNIFDFSTEEPDFDVFDTSFCSAPGEYAILSLIIPGQEYGSDLGQLRRSIRLGLSQWAGIPKLQVANIQIVGENGTAIFATLQILTIPDIAQYPNPRSPQTIMEMILNKTSADDRLPFTITLPSGQMVTPYLLRVNPDCPVPSTTTSTATATPTSSSSSSSSSSTSSSSSSSSSSTTTGTNSTSSSSVPSATSTTGTSTTSVSSALSPSSTAATATTSNCVPTKCTATVTIGASCPITATTATAPATATATAPATAPATGTATKPPPTSTEGANASNCPKSSSNNSSGLSNGAAAGLSIAMFIIGMICALLMVLLVKCWQSRRKTFHLAGNKYSRQENEMEGFAE